MSVVTAFRGPQRHPLAPQPCAWPAVVPLPWLTNYSLHTTNRLREGARRPWASQLALR